MVSLRTEAVPADAGFLCDKAVVLRETTKETHCTSFLMFASEFLTNYPPLSSLELLLSSLNKQNIHCPPTRVICHIHITQHLICRHLFKANGIKKRNLIVIRIKPIVCYKLFIEFVGVFCSLSHTENCGAEGVARLNAAWV